MEPKPFTGRGLRVRPLASLFTGLIALLLAFAQAQAGVTRVPPERGAAEAAIEAAAPGDVIVLAPGIHAGPLVVQRTLTVRGEPGAVVDGGGQGTVVRIAADGVVLEGLTIQASGNRVITIDSGIYVANSRGVLLRRLVLRDVLYGIYVERAESLAVEHCLLSGRVRPLDEGGTGNGIHLWNSSDARFLDDTIERFADGIYLSFAHRTRVIESRLHDCGRYGLHTMYCQGTELLGNLFTRNVAGCAIMFSNQLRVRRNAFLRNQGSRTYGLLLRDCSSGEFEENRFEGNTIAIFMDNSNRNRIRANLFQDNGWGMLLFSSCAGNETAGNTFLNNDYPVALDMRRSDNRFDDGHVGNFWSENAPYDLNADGISDIPYSPVSAFAFLSKQYPDLSLFARSPAVAAITVAERVFPALRPSEVVDNFPLVAPAAGTGGVRGPEGRAGKGKPAWAAAAGFGALLLGGIVGLVRGKASR